VARPVLPGLLIVGGGILFLLGGLVLVGLGGDVGAAGAATGMLTILIGILIPLLPSRKGALAFVALVLGTLSIFFALAGFVVGIFLVILGSMLAFIWVPPSSGDPKPRPR
jgi:hypothetical protein